MITGLNPESGGGFQGKGLLHFLRIYLQKPKAPSDALSSALSAMAIHSRVPAAAPHPQAAAPDVADAAISACAVAAHADLFVTGDKALRHLKRVGEMPIVSPRRFLERYIIGK